MLIVLLYQYIASLGRPRGNFLSSSYPIASGVHVISYVQITSLLRSAIILSIPTRAVFAKSVIINNKYVGWCVYLF